MQEVQKQSEASPPVSRPFADSDTASADASDLEPGGESKEIEVIGKNLERTDYSAPSADRNAKIAEAAYRRAERRGFAPGGELEDWLEAEREIDGTAANQTPPEDQFTG